MTPFLQDPDVTLYHGDVLDVLAQMPDGSVDCVVTSPPYWGLRSYLADGHEDKPLELGLEETPDQYVTRLVAVFQEVRRVLAPHGTCWVNLGDSYASAWACDRRNVVGAGSLEHGKREDRPNRLVGGLKEKDLVGIPWRVAFALQADGWWLRSDIVWAKPNPMPESVTDRPTKAHEYVFLLTKASRYYFDQEAVREDFDARPQAGNGSIQHRDGERWPNAGRNVRSVWTIATQPYPEAHFATYPEELVRRCVLAGCPERVCRTCGKPSERIVERGALEPTESARISEWDRGKTHGYEGTRAAHLQRDGFKPNHQRTVETVGWSDCGCLLVEGDARCRPLSDSPSTSKWRPGLVLDPFVGSGTTCKVSRDHGRHSIGIDLNETYL